MNYKAHAESAELAARNHKFNSPTTDIAAISPLTLRLQSNPGSKNETVSRAGMLASTLIYLYAYVPHQVL